MMPHHAETGRPNDVLVKKWQMKAMRHRQGMFDAACNIENLAKGFISKMNDGSVQDPDDFEHLADSLESEVHEFNNNRITWHGLNLACNASKDKTVEDSTK